MPRYFFHLFNDVVSLDDEGLELPGLPDAKEKALEEARILVCESVKKGHLNLDHRIELSDETGQKVLTLTFRDAFTIDG